MIIKQADDHPSSKLISWLQSFVYLQTNTQITEKGKEQELRFLDSTISLWIEVAKHVVQSTLMFCGIYDGGILWKILEGPS